MVENMSLDTDIEVEETEEEYLKRIKSANKVALRPFPKFDKGEKIGAIEFKKRLGEIKNTGYYVKPYSHMNKEEAENYLEQIKSELKNALRRPAYFDR